MAHTREQVVAHLKCKNWKVSSFICLAIFVAASLFLHIVRWTSRFLDVRRTVPLSDVLDYLPEKSTEAERSDDIYHFQFGGPGLSSAEASVFAAAKNLSSMLISKLGSNPAGNIANSIGQSKWYAWHAQRPGVMTICETGFFQGHSASIFLQANKKAKMVSLEVVDQHSGARDLLHSIFPGRFFFVEGDSAHTLPRLPAILQSQGFHDFQKCDLISIDGNALPHGGPLIEMRLWEQHAHHATIVLIDDCKFKALAPWSRECIMEARSSDLEKAVASGLMQVHGDRKSVV